MRKNCLRILAIIALALLPLFQSQLSLAETDAVTPTTHMPAALVLGQPGFTTNAAATTQSGMRTPYSVAVDPTTGKVFVADQINQRVLRFASLATLSNGLAAEGVLGQPDFVSSIPNRGGAPAPNSLFSPMGVSVDSQGRLWVADTLNNRVLRFDDAAAKANGADADAVLGQPDFNSSGAATTQNRLSQPIDCFCRFHQAGCGWQIIKTAASCVSMMPLLKPMERMPTVCWGSSTSPAPAWLPPRMG